MDKAWRPDTDSAFFGGNGNGRFVIGRGKQPESEIMAPMFQDWATCVVGAALANGHQSDDEIIDYANQFYLDPASLADALLRADDILEDMNAASWSLPDRHSEPPIRF